VIGGGPWDTLGIEPTTDARAIRAAYAQRLKEIDVEADPQAFVALREAFDAAQRDVFGPAPIRLDAPVDAAAALADTLPETACTEIHPAAALEALLFGECKGEPPTSEQRETMLRHWGAIIADPRMQEIGYYGDVETWASETIARTVPLSDPLVIPAVLHFAWIGRAGTTDLSPAIAYVVDRYHPMMFVDYVERPHHPLHRAWAELTSPADAGAKLRRGKVPLVEIHKLVSHVVRNYPELYARFDPWRLSLWRVSPTDLERDNIDERGPGPGGLIGWIISALIAILVLGTLIYAHQSANPYRVEAR
jgi:hypothetical protein